MHIIGVESCGSATNGATPLRVLDITCWVLFYITKGMATICDNSDSDSDSDSDIGDRSDKTDKSDSIDSIVNS